MMNLSNITFQDVVNFAAACIVLFEFGKWIISFGNPIVELRKRTDRHDELLNHDKTHLEKLDKGVEKVDEGVTVIGKALNELLRHEITGNDIDALKEQHRNLNNYFYGDEHGR